MKMPSYVGGIFVSRPLLEVSYLWHEKILFTFHFYQHLIPTGSDMIINLSGSVRSQMSVAQMLVEFIFAL